ncbi:MAG: hypothetical protein Q8S00_01065 [Deltaproteobacteria bacterium]|nr:hypothetical protein [Deltaproteobacteria bacterium]MDZ4343133.1 hypothetical protein [Candidatus Binatia bacterium]
MNLFKGSLVVAILALISTVVPSISEGADWGRFGCRRGARIDIQDLDMSPDPIMEGQRIRAWKVRINFAGARECETEIEVREGGDVVARTPRINLRPGVNEIEVPPVERYRLHGREHCFVVTADLEGTRRDVDAARRFCARQRMGWSLREPGDRDRPGR